jgi:peptide/nickel transport system permease protein
MTTFILRRAIGLIPLLIGITFISFVVIHLAPGTPVGAKGDFNPKMTSQARQKLEELYGLNKPLHAQYTSWVKDICRFRFGKSFFDGEDVTKKIAKAIPVTLGVNLAALILMLVIGIPIGVYSVVYKGGPFDRCMIGFSLAALSFPSFWLALVLIGLFAVRWHLFPATGLSSLLYDDMSFGGKFVDVVRHLALPLVVASLGGVAVISRFMRASMTEALGQNYIRTARAKGLPERLVLYRHALKNALLPVITLIGLSVPHLLGGSVIFESIFSIPGMGRLFYNSVFARDYPVIMGILVLGAVLTLLGNLLADIAYHLADPRIRIDEK